MGLIRYFNAKLHSIAFLDGLNDFSTNFIVELLEFIFQSKSNSINFDSNPNVLDASKVVFKDCTIRYQLDLKSSIKLYFELLLEKTRYNGIPIDSVVIELINLLFSWICVVGEQSVKCWPKTRNLINVVDNVNKIMIE